MCYENGIRHGNLNVRVPCKMYIIILLALSSFVCSLRDRMTVDDDIDFPIALDELHIPSQNFEPYTGDSVFCRMYCNLDFSVALEENNDSE